MARSPCLALSIDAGDTKPFVAPSGHPIPHVMSINQGKNDHSHLGWEWKYSLRLGSFIVLAVGWELLAHNAGSLLMPSFTETLGALARLPWRPQLWEALWTSNQAMALGFTFAAIAGVLFGLLAGRWRVVERFVDPYLNVLLVTPMVAVIPVVIMATGLGLVSRVIVVFSFAFATVAINTLGGVRMVDPGLIEMARSFGATERQLRFKIILRGASPAILTGLRLGLIRAVSGMVTVELLLIPVGVGHLILDFQSYFEAANLYATVIVVIAEAVILMQLSQRLERRAAPWAGEAIFE